MACWRKEEIELKASAFGVRSTKQSSGATNEMCAYKKPLVARRVSVVAGKQAIAVARKEGVGGT